MADADHRSHDDENLGLRLQSLPLHAPASDLWPELSRHLQSTAAAPRRRRRWHPAAALALAASLVIAALLPWTVDRPSTSLPIETAMLSDQASADMDWLQARSLQLETWLAELPSAPMHGGRELMATVEVEDLIGLVDLQLSATDDAVAALPLWRQRVALLENLSLLRAAAFGVNDAVADRGVGATPLNHL